MAMWLICFRTLVTNMLSQSSQRDDNITVWFFLFLCQTFFTMLSLCLHLRNEVVGETMYVYIYFYCNGTDNWQSCPYICYVHSVPWNYVMTIIPWIFTIRPCLFFPFQYGLFFLSGFMDIVFILNKMCSDNFSFV